MSRGSLLVAGWGAYRCRGKGDTTIGPQEVHQADLHSFEAEQPQLQASLPAVGFRVYALRQGCRLSLDGSEA